MAGPGRYFFLLIASVLLVTPTACGLRIDNEALIARARVAAGENEYRAAIIDLKSVLQRDPRNAEARAFLGRVYLDVGEPFSAEKELRRALDLGVPKGQLLVPLGEALLAQRVFDLVLDEITVDIAQSDADRLEVKLLRGNSALGLGRPKRARVIYVDVLDLDPENPIAYLGLASSFIAEQQMAEAELAINRAIEVAPEFGPAWIARGALRLTRRQLDAAEEDLTQALKLSNNRRGAGHQATALAGLTDIHLIRSDLQAARESAARLNSIAPNSIAARYSLARVAFAAGNYGQAVKLLQGILKDIPDFRQAHFLYGAVSRAQGNFAQAEMYLSSTVAAQPNNVEARKLLADVRIQQRKPREAIDALAPLLSSELADDNLLATAGMVKIQMGEYAEGLDLVRRSVDADPSNLERQLDLAAIYVAVGQVDQAIAILESLAGSEANPQRLGELAIITLQRKGELTEATRIAEELIAAAPDSARLHTIIGGLYQQAGKLAEARHSYERALELNRLSVAALLLLGKLDIGEQRYPEARSQYRRALQIAPDSTPVMLEMARLAMLEGDAATSVSWLEKARDKNDSALAPRLVLASHYLSRDRPEDAMRIAEEAVLIDESHAGARNILGVTQMVTGDFGVAKQNFVRAIKLEPDNSSYYYNHARAELALGNTSAAWKEFKANNERFPGHIPTASHLAVYHLQNDEISAANGVASRLQAALPESAAGIALRGDILAAQRNYSAAADVYDQALQVEQSRELAIQAVRLRIKSSNSAPYQPIEQYLESNPEDLTARTFLAETYNAGGKSDRAAMEYDKLLLADPDNAVAMNNLSWILFETGDRRAEEIAATAYGLLPGNGAIADTYGWILLNHGQADKASKILRSAIVAMPGNAEIHYHLGVALVEIGKENEALAVLTKIVESDAEFESRSAAEELIDKIRLGRQPDVNNAFSSADER